MKPVSSAADRMSLPMGRLKTRTVTVLLTALLLTPAAHADTVIVAVAANFTKVAEQLAPLFKAETGHDVTYSFGATGQLTPRSAKARHSRSFLRLTMNAPPRLSPTGSRWTARCSPMPSGPSRFTAPRST